MNRTELLKATSTRGILGQFKKQRPYLIASDEYSMDEGDVITLKYTVKGGEVISFPYSKKELKEELATRPHVPNKRESRGLRLLKIRQGR